VFLLAVFVTIRRGRHGGGVVVRGWFTIMFFCFSHHIFAVVVGGSGGLEIWVIKVL
jgi:hypothetical protein